MCRSRLPSSLMVVGLVACVAAGDARAIERTSLRDATALVKGGVHFVRRALGLEQDTAVLSHTVSLSPREAALELELADGTSRVVAFRAGEVRLDGAVVGRYRTGGALDRAWRRLLAEAGKLRHAGPARVGPRLQGRGARRRRRRGRAPRDRRLPQPRSPAPPVEAAQARRRRSRRGGRRGPGHGRRGRGLARPRTDDGGRAHPRQPRPDAGSGARHRPRPGGIGAPEPRPHRARDGALGPDGAPRASSSSAATRKSSAPSRATSWR